MEWSNGETSWIREKNIPSGLKRAGLEKVVKAVDVVQFGKKLKFLVKTNPGEIHEGSEKVEK